MSAPGNKKSIGRSGIGAPSASETVVIGLEFILASASVRKALKSSHGKILRPSVR
ncbi:unnamed protein product [Meloidogyne enterolobii]|uniref:Uncharacterized protein n=1 Tax=Meloidogyne enterolobii TaxID=390850 RepID=A0ACB0YBY7_MELEN